MAAGTGVTVFQDSDLGELLYMVADSGESAYKEPTQESRPTTGLRWLA
jgi:hypothetical protein